MSADRHSWSHRYYQSNWRFRRKPVISQYIDRQNSGSDLECILLISLGFQLYLI